MPKLETIEKAPSMNRLCKYAVTTYDILKRVLADPSDSRISAEARELITRLEKGPEVVKVKICRDEDAEDPRDMDNLGHLVHWHRRRILASDSERVATPADAKRFMDHAKAIHIKPVYAYEHSNICLSFSPFQDPFDSGQVG